MQRSDDVLSLASVVLTSAQRAHPSTAPRNARSPTRHAGVETLQQQLREAEEALQVVRRVPPKKKGRGGGKGPTPAFASHPGLLFGAVGAPTQEDANGGASQAVPGERTPPPGASEASSPEEVRSKAASLAAGLSSGADSLTASPAGLITRSDEARAREARLVGGARDSIELAYPAKGVCEE